MKINDVENVVGITKKNIRFYEQAGLLDPIRNPQNGYREYSDIDIQQLFCIKLMRKLGFPLDEIRSMQNGTLTIADGMKRHVISLNREQENLDNMINVCQSLSSCNEKLETFDAQKTLIQIEQLEEGGVTFMNKQENDNRKAFIAPILSSALVILCMIFFIGISLWASYGDTGDTIPIAMTIFFIAFPIFVIIGAISVTHQRIKELKKGELYEASKY